MVATVSDFPPSLRTSAHTGVAIRIPHGTVSVDRLPTKDCHVALVLLAMTVENLAVMEPPDFRVCATFVIL